MARSQFMNTVKEGFAVSIGAMGAFILYIFIGMLFFIPGYLLFMSEKKKSRVGNGVTVIQMVGIILMIIGVVLMGGLGFGVLLGDLGDMM
jgi:uncharacterized membrane protein YidH (DUF202 family)